MALSKSAHVLFIDDSERVLLRLRDDRPDLPYPGQWDLVGGAVESGETIREAAMREVEEEIDRKVTALEYFGEYPDRVVNHVFLARLSVPIEELVLNEGQRLAYVDAAQAADMDVVVWVARLLRDFFASRVSRHRSAATLPAPDSAALHVRSAAAHDVPAIARCHVRAWRAAYVGHVPQSVLDNLDEERRAEMWRRQLQSAGHGVLVAVRARDVLGFSSIVRSRDGDATEDTGEIAAIYVDPDHVGQGLGRALMQASLELAWRRSYRAITLWVIESNTRAQRFYGSFGFVPDGASKTEKLGDHALAEVRYRVALPEDGPPPRSAPRE
jgi:GNAT superfamily N-acetyltransferase/8-oxo-dGTP pyrophosphatase MutT (NUDIX family)